MVVESCSADFPGFIKEIDGEQTALPTLIMPLFDFGFISHANSDRPSIVSHKSHLGILILIRGEPFNRVDSDVSTDISNARKRGNTEKVGPVALAVVGVVGVLVVAVLVHTYSTRLQQEQS